jgi:D-sedoheptulose 7-phosphate isomerase
MSFATDEIRRTSELLQAMLGDKDLLTDTDRVADACVKAIKDGKKVMFAGNGGSAADAQHLAAELVGKLSFDRPGLPSMSLTTDTSILTAVGNDYSYEDVFHRQIQSIGMKGDVFIGISTSGRSKNLVKALATAREKGIVTVGLTGQTGGDMRALCDICLRVPSTDTQKIQEAQIVLGHIFCGLVERAMFPRGS